MSQDVQKWIQQSLDLLDRIRIRFNTYFQIQRSSRHSLNSSDGEIDLSAKIQNQWRKLNQLISKEIPEKQKNIDSETCKKLDVLKAQALRILNMFKSKFGEEKHNQFKLLQVTQSWKKPIFKSGLRNYQSESNLQLKKTQYELISENSESKAKSSIIIEQPQVEQQEIIKKLEESERRSYSRLYKEKDKQKWTKICGILLICALVLVLLMQFITIPMPTNFKQLLQIEL